MIRRIADFSFKLVQSVWRPRPPRARAVHPAGLRLHGQERAGRVADRLFHVRLWFHPCFIPLHAVHEQQTRWQRPPNTRKHYTQQHLLVEVQVLNFVGAVVIG